MVAGKVSFNSLLESEDGQAMVETSLLLALVSIAAVAGVTSLGQAMYNSFKDSVDKIVAAT